MTMLPKSYGHIIHVFNGNWNEILLYNGQSVFSPSIYQNRKQPLHDFKNFFTVYFMRFLGQKWLKKRMKYTVKLF